jgi:transcriptional regulator with XRE-family HTH domain
LSDELSRQVAKRVLSLTKKGESWKDFADRVGLTPQVVSNWRGGDGASLEGAAKVLRHHRPRLSPAWLLAGVRPKYLPEDGDLETAAREEAGEFAFRLQVIGSVVNGEIAPATIQAIEEMRRQQSREVTGDELAEMVRRVAAASKSGGST